MMTLPTRSKDQIVATVAAGIQGRVSAFINFAIGSIFLAVAEAQAGVSLWLQSLIIQVLGVTRAATSNGPDLDTYVADYGLVRLPAIPATGLVTFSRFTASATTALIPVGTIVQTGDGSQRFTVYADTSNGAYSAGQGGYVVPANVAAVQVPVSALVPGAGANIGAGAITLIGSSVSGLDTVVNPAAFVTGVDAESDQALRTRFQLFLNSLAKGTEAAIGYAIISLQQGLQYSISGSHQPDGTFDPGFVTVFVDDGSGATPDSVLSAARVAVDAVRAAGDRVGVFKATPLPARVSMTIDVAPGFYKPDAVVAVTNALSAYINGLRLGEKLRFTRLEQIAYDATPAVTNVSSTRLNGTASDLLPSIGQTVKVEALIVS